jgi:hypothetical protein
LPYEAVAQALAQGDVSVHLLSGTLGGSPRLVAGVSGLGRCEPEWVVVEPRVAGDRVVFAPLGADDSDAPAVSWLKQHASIALPPALVRLRTKLDRAEERFSTEAPRRLAGTGIRLDAPIAVVPTAKPGSETLRVGYSVEGTLKVVPSEPCAAAEPSDCDED